MADADLNELLDAYHRVAGELPTDLTAHVEFLLAAREDAAAVLASMPQPSPVKPGRNDPCPCGSGKKFKRCCVDAAPTV